MRLPRWLRRLDTPLPRLEALIRFAAFGLIVIVSLATVAHVQQLRDSECERAAQLWQRKFGAAALDARERARQMRFLLARGFEAAVAQQVIRESTGPADDEVADEGTPED